jgi:hypothetical protein
MDLKQFFTETSVSVLVSTKLQPCVLVCHAELAVMCNVLIRSVFETEFLLFKNSPQDRVISGYRSSVPEY